MEYIRFASVILFLVNAAFMFFFALHFQLFIVFHVWSNIYMIIDKHLCLDCV